MSPAEFPPPIGAFMELRSNANLPCLVNLAQGVTFDRLTLYSKVQFVYFMQSLSMLVINIPLFFICVNS